MAEQKKDVVKKGEGKELNAVTDHGKTTVYDAVVAKVAGLAVREVKGVYDLGSTMGRAMGSLRSVVGASENVQQGVSVEVGEKQAALDITLIVEYPYPVFEVASNVREATITAIENLVGLEVTEVNIDVTDVHLPTPEKEEEDKKEDPRVK